MLCVTQALVCRSVGLRQACTHAQLVCSKAYSKTGGTEHTRGSMIGGSSKVMQAWQEPSVRLCSTSGAWYGMQDASLAY